MFSWYFEQNKSLFSHSSSRPSLSLLLASAVEVRSTGAGSDSSEKYSSSVRPPRPRHQQRAHLSLGWSASMFSLSLVDLLSNVNQDSVFAWSLIFCACTHMCGVTKMSKTPLFNTSCSLLQNGTSCCAFCTVNIHNSHSAVCSPPPSCSSCANQFEKLSISTNKFLNIQPGLCPG